MNRHSVGKILYGFVFVAALPVALAAWAYGTRAVVRPAAIHSPAIGAAIALMGLTLTARSMFLLWQIGGGLPMNAYPPARFVSKGIYALLPHPIYIGFVLACAGLSILIGSASGLWLITPFAALGCAALVLGYESPDLNRRFGRENRVRILPPDNDSTPPALAVARSYLLVLLPWLVFYELIVLLGTPSDAVASYFRFEQRIPVWQWTEILYFSTYVVVVLSPLLIRTSRGLRAFMLRGWIAMAMVFPTYGMLPLIAPPRPFLGDTVWGRLLQFERIADSPAASFPSFHVIWACIAAAALGTTRARKFTWYTWAALVAASCITTGSHSLLDIAAGFGTWIIILNAGRIWRVLLSLTEAMADSWHEWHIGPLRIINHGIYAFVAVFLGMFILDSLLGNGGDAAVISIFLCASVGAALWAQIVEGSPALLRPLGFYGGVLGGIAGAFIAPVANIPTWTALSALAVAAPVIQGIGRLRCVVQGCCHGRPAHSVPGIRYINLNSRVCRLAGLRDVEIHPTPLYSLLWNGIIFLVLARLLTLHTTTTMLCGIYLLLGGLGRFVEEAYRGEPQTLAIYGLSLYQWLAITSVVVGAIFTAITLAPPTPVLHLHSSSPITAATCGVLAWFLCAMDFPKSAKRFARLT